MMRARHRGTAAVAGAPARIRTMDVELGEAPPPVAARSADGRMDASIRALVRLHGCPLGVVDLDLPERGLGAEALALAIARELGEEIHRHLADDELMPGAADAASPRCLARRRALRDRAPRASVIVATRERPQSLSRCLRSLRALDYPDYEVIVVDNAPATTATAALVAARHSDEVHYTVEDRPGLAAAHNRGMAEARGEILAFTDDDVVVDRHWLLELAMGFELAPDVGCVTGMIVAAELQTRAQVWSEARWGLGKGFAPRVFRSADRDRLGALFPFAAGRFGSGANMAFRAQTLHDVGGFDPALGTGTPACGGDDLAIFFAVIAAGYSLVYSPGAIIRHWHRRDYASLRRQAYGYGSGLTAYLTKTVADDPRRIVGLATGAPAGLLRVVSPRSPKNAGTPADYPRELKWCELLGMLHGPARYLRARTALRRVQAARARRASGAPEIRSSV
jgi:O-antigen biosynthesis protein